MRQTDRQKEKYVDIQEYFHHTFPNSFAAEMTAPVAAGSSVGLLHPGPNGLLREELGVSIAEIERDRVQTANVAAGLGPGCAVGGQVQRAEAVEAGAGDDAEEGAADGGAAGHAADDAAAVLPGGGDAAQFDGGLVVEDHRATIA